MHETVGRAAGAEYLGPQNVAFQALRKDSGTFCLSPLPAAIVVANELLFLERQKGFTEAFWETVERKKIAHAA